MVELELESHFAKGRQRACYEVPGDPGLCVKVEFVNNQDSSIRVNEELQAHERILARGEECSVVSLFRGEVKTSLGAGYLFDLIRNADGEISPTLRSCEEELGEDKVVGLVKGFYHEVIKQQLVIGDLHPKNLVVRDESELVLIDGLGAIDHAWLYYSIPLLRVIKLRRKFRRLCRFLGVSAKEVLGA